MEHVLKTSYIWLTLRANKMAAFCDATIAAMMDDVTIAAMMDDVNNNRLNVTWSGRHCPTAGRRSGHSCGVSGWSKGQFAHFMVIRLAFVV